jgi:adenylylsulfate kinase
LLRVAWERRLIPLCVFCPHARARISPPFPAAAGAGVRSGLPLGSAAAALSGSAMSSAAAVGGPSATDGKGTAYAVGSSTNIRWHEGAVSREAREGALNQKGAVLWFTGLSGSGKSTVAYTLEHLLFGGGKNAFVLDGDNIRHGLNKNLGFSAADRTENIRRIGEVAKLFSDAGTLTLVSFISPYRADREAVRARVGDRFVEVYMRIPLAVCEQRDPKGLYKAARAGKIKGFTGIDDPYEEPLSPELDITVAGEDGVMASPTAMAEQIKEYLQRKGFLEGTA